MCNYIPSDAFCTQSYKLRPFVDPKNFCFLNKLNLKKIPDIKKADNGHRHPITSYTYAKLDNSSLLQNVKNKKSPTWRG